jgi:hypothetical protein
MQSAVSASCSITTLVAGHDQVEVGMDGVGSGSSENLLIPWKTR